MPLPAQENRTAHGLAFPATRWTLIFRAKAGGREGSAALEELCRRYWRPIYAYLRRRGHATVDAEDYTQQFFAEMLADRTLQAAEPAQGRLRTFLLAALQRSLADHARFRCRQKRGGGVAPLSLDVARLEELQLSEPMDSRDPEKVYLAGWAQSLVDAAKAELKATYGSRAALYGALEGFLELDPARPSYGEAAAALGITEVAARVHVSRLRKRFGELLRQQVRQTVENESEVDAELEWLLRALRGG